METISLILPLEATAVNNPRDSNGVTAGAIAGVPAGVTAVAAEKQRIDSGQITEQYWNDTGAKAERQQE